MEGLRAVSNRDVTKVTLEGVPDNPGIAGEIFGALGMRGLNVELVVSTGGSRGRADISLAISRSQEQQSLATLEEIRREVGATSVQVDSQVALVSLVGHSLTSQPGVAGCMFGALSRAGVNIEVISTSLSSVTCMIREEMVDKAILAIREEFDLAL